MSRKNVSDLLVCLAHYVRDEYDKLDLPTPVLLTKIVPLEKNLAEDWLIYWTGEPFKVVYAAMKRALGHGYLEYGVWLRRACLEPSGQDLLAQELGIEFCRDKLD